MRGYKVILAKTAEEDLLSIFRYIGTRASRTIALAYVRRIRSFLERLADFPERGTVRNDIRPGLRIIGFERRVSVAFVVEDRNVVVLRLLYGGRPFEQAELDR
jgi:plasmid stabilization system protein ParE